MNVNKFTVLIILFVVNSFFYAGTMVSSPEPDMFDLLVDLASLCASIATVVGIFIAYGAYQSWLKPIRYQSVSTGIKNLKLLKDDLFVLLEDASHSLQRIQNRTNHVLLNYDLEEHKNDEFLQRDLRDIDTETTEIFEKILKFHTEFRERFSLEVLENLSQPLENGKDVPLELNEFAINVSNLCRLLMNCSIRLGRLKANDQMLLDGEKELTLVDFEYDGSVERELNKRYSCIVEHYANKWGL